MKQYQFSLKDECMKELPSMKEPKKIYQGALWQPRSLGSYLCPYCGYSSSTSVQQMAHHCILDDYNKHIASLQSIPVPKDYLSSFIDGKIYNEDEFEICKYQGETFAVSIPKQKVDDTGLPLFNLGFEIKFIKNELLPPNTAMVSKDIYEILKNNYQNK
jgi:hypothetical protein